MQNLRLPHHKPIVVDHTCWARYDVCSRKRYCSLQLLCHEEQIRRKLSNLEVDKLARYLVSDDDFLRKIALELLAEITEEVNCGER